MSTSHHGNPEIPQDDESKKKLRETMERFVGQLEKRAVREYPEGRLGALDDGTLAFAMRTDPKTKTIIIDFGKPVAWIGLKEKDAQAFIQLLIQRLREIATEPFALNI